MLQQKAPNWHAKLPVVMTSEVRPAPASSLPSERLLGEICDALEAMAAETPLILVFEDLHWADHSTLDLISALARRRAQAKLMLIATYRPGRHQRRPASAQGAETRSGDAKAVRRNCASSAHQSGGHRISGQRVGANLSRPQA